RPSSRAFHRLQWHPCAQARRERHPTPRSLSPLSESRRRRGNKIASQSPLRVAVAGAGAFGRNHLRVYRELESAGLGVTLVGAVEPDAARAAEAAAKFKLPVFPTIGELLAADLKLDAASVAVPTIHHCAVASELLAGGLDLLIEKPLAANLHEADELISQAEKND